MSSDTKYALSAAPRGAAAPVAGSVQAPRYRPVEPRPPAVVFPSDAHPDERPMEKKWHRLVCNLFYELLEAAFGTEALLALNQFLYWDASDNKKKLAPDVGATPGRKDSGLSSWKTWELGAPAFVLEVVSDASWPDDVRDKPAKYDAIGVAEYLVFDPEWDERAETDGHPPRLLRAWRRIDGALAEVELDEADRYFCEQLGLWARACPSDNPASEGLSCLRLGCGERGVELVPTDGERARDEAERADVANKRAEAEAAARRRAQLEADRAEALGRARALGELLESGVVPASVAAGAVIDLLEARSIDVPADVRRQVLACSDSGVMKTWLLRAATAPAAAEVVAEAEP